MMKTGIIVVVVLLIGAIFPLLLRQVEEARKNAQLPAKQLAFFNARFISVQPRGRQAVLIPDPKWGGWNDHFHTRSGYRNRLLSVIISRGSQFQPFGADRTTHYVVQRVENDGVLLSGDGLKPFKLKWK